MNIYIQSGVQPRIPSVSTDIRSLRMETNFKVGVIGTGPAAMFAVLELTRLAPGVSVVMFEKGRIRSAGEASSTRAALDAGERVNVTEGWGGAGAFSDGKFNLDESGRVGGRLVGDGLVSQEVYAQLLHEAARIYVQFGADSDRTFGIKDETHRPTVTDLKLRAAAKDLEIHEFPIMHLGTSKAHLIVENIRAELERRGVVILAECKVEDLAREGDGWRLITEKGEFVVGKVIACPGRSGSNSFIPVLERQGVKLTTNGIDIGVRVETSMDVMRWLTDMFYELKLYHWGRDQVRTFCMCPEGRVAVEEYRDTGIFCANGHTDPAHPSANCNFAVLVTQRFTAPFNDPLGYAKDIAGLHTKLAGGKGVLVQRLGDLREGRRSKDSRMNKGRIKPTCTDRVVPGNLELAMPGRFLGSIVRYLDAMAELAPGIASDHTLLYAPEIKFNAAMVEADPTRGFEALPSLYVAGDGVGYTRGLNGASVQGMIVGRWVAENLNT